MRTHFKTLSDRIVPFDRVVEIRLTLQGEDAIISKLKYAYPPDFYILVDDGTIEAFSCANADTWSTEPSEYINHWAHSRHQRFIGKLLE